MVVVVVVIVIVFVVRAEAGRESPHRLVARVNPQIMMQDTPVCYCTI